MKLPNLDHCFACGKDNPRGLHLVKKTEGGKAVMELAIDEDHCGFPGILHGGITVTMLDEVMSYAIFDQNMLAVTSSINVDFTRPGKVGHSVKVAGWVEKVDGRHIESAAVATDMSTGECLARARGAYKTVNFDAFGKA